MVSKLQNLIEVYSHYSVQVGFDTPELLASRLAALGHSYFPISDFNNNFGFVEQTRSAIKHGLQPIYSVLLVLFFDGNKIPVVFTVKTSKGFEIVCSLIAKAQRRRQEFGEPLLMLDDLVLDVNGQEYFCFIDLSFFSGNPKLYEALDLLVLVKVSCNLINADFKSLSPILIKLNVTHVYPHVPVFFSNKEDKIYHDYKFKAFRGEEQDIFSGEFSSLNSLLVPEDLSLLEQRGDFGSFVVSSVADCYNDCTFIAKIDVVILPEYPFTGDMSESSYLNQLVWDSFASRESVLASANPQYSKDEYVARINEELDVITTMGFSGYFLVVWDYIRWSKENGIPVGAGRGSGAGSMVAFLLDIVELDPIKYELLFERFLNKERKSMPDIDTDFCIERRGEVIDYVRRRYGHDCAAQITTFTKLGVKASLKDAGRLLGINVDALCKLIPSVPDLTFESVESSSSAARDELEKDDYQQVLLIAKSLFGKIRSISKHAGGVVISKGAIYQYASLYYDDSGNSAVMLDMHDAEAVGLVKFDTLGVANLTMVDKSVKELKSRGVELDIKSIDVEDPNVYAFLRKCLTQGTFQLFSQGMRALIKRLEPDCFEELIALIALYRPGPLQSGMVDHFVARKHGLKKVYYPEEGATHQTLESVLENTYGVILYQEQVMKAAQNMSGYTLGQADLLRRAMGKKKPEEMEKQKSIFISGAVSRGVDSDLAEHIFHIIEKFSGYGFNRSHSAVYAFLSFQTLYLKTYYPAVFMSCVMTSESGDHAKLSSIVSEIGSYGLTLEPVSVNHSRSEFYAVTDSAIVFGLSAIKGLGLSVSEQIVTERLENGLFESISNFHERMKHRSLNKGHLVGLVFSGAFDEITPLSGCIAYLDDVFGLDKIKYAVSIDSESVQANQIALCGVSFSIYKILSGFAKEHQLAKCIGLSDVTDKSDGSIVLVGGVLRSAVVINGDRPRLKADLMDLTGSIELVGWSEFIKNYSNVMQAGDFVICECKVGSYRDTKQLTMLRAWDLNFIRTRLRI